MKGFSLTNLPKVLYSFRAVFSKFIVEFILNVEFIGLGNTVKLFSLIMFFSVDNAKA